MIPQPCIPGGLLREMAELKAAGRFAQEAGGQWRPDVLERVPFQGAVLPVSDRDLQRAPAGTYTQDSEKVYTNGHALSVGARIEDPQTGGVYTVIQELGHNSIHPLKRYVVERKGSAAAR